MLGDANTHPACVCEGRFRDRENYKKGYNLWKWPALEWVRDLVREQLTFEKSEDKVIVQPMMDGYGLHIEGSDIFYEITHAEVLGDTLNSDA